METSKILSADILDLLFDNRNKDYGAYELRKTYQQRIIKSLLITAVITAIVFASAVLANSIRHVKGDRYRSKELVIQSIPEEKKPEKLPEPKSQPDIKPSRTEIFTAPTIVNKDNIEKPLPTQDDLDSAKIGLVKLNGNSDKGTDENIKPVDDKGIFDTKENSESNEPFKKVEIEAKFNGNWENFLKRNLRAEVPVDNGAPPGRHTVIIQFVVDIDGTVSNIQPLTNLGYGMEEEAMRVLRKANKWEPAIQNGIPVKAYRRQPVTFEVLTDD